MFLENYDYLWNFERAARVNFADVHVGAQCTFSKCSDAITLISVYCYA